MHLHGLLVRVVHVRLALGYHLAGQLWGWVEGRGEKGQNYGVCGMGWHIVSIE